jgi:hypothetical protein
MRRLRTDSLLRRHQDPQDRVDQDLAARDKHEQQHEEDSRGPRFDAEASAEAGAHAAQYPPLTRSDQTLLGEAVVDLVRVDGALPSGWYPGRLPDTYCVPHETSGPSGTALT